MFVDFNILNQLGSPSINSNTFANRPAAGQTGRLFVSTDTFEIYRDNGTTWDLIGGPGSSTITGTGTATQVAYFTSSQAIGSSANLFWDNTNSYLGVNNGAPAYSLDVSGSAQVTGNSYLATNGTTQVGINTTFPTATAKMEVNSVDGYGLYLNYSTNTGSGSTATALWAKNITNSSGFAAVIEESTPNTTAGQYPLLVKHSLSTGTAGVGMGTGVHFQLPDDAGTFKTTQLTIETTDAAAATYKTRYRFNVQNNGSSLPVGYINATGLGIFVAAPSGLIHADGGANAARIILDADTGVARIFSFRTDNLPRWALRVDGTETGSNAGADFALRAYDDTGAFTFAPMSVTRATGKTSFQAQQTYTTGLARGNYFDYNLSVSAGGSFSSPNSITALGASLDLTLAGSATIPSGARSGLDAYNSIGFTGTGTLTHTQGTQIRAYSNITAGWAFNGSATGTITHLAGLRALFPDNTGSAVTVTNNYALLLNDQTANTGTVTYTNRWGVYQEGASDLNYFAANTLIGLTVNAGYKLDVNGVIHNNAAVFVSQGIQGNSSGFTFSGVGSNYGRIYESANDKWALGYSASYLGASTPVLNWTSGGLVGIGTAAPKANLDVAAVGNSKIYISSYFAGPSAPELTLFHSNSNTLNTNTATVTGQILGQITFAGVENGGAIDDGAYIQAVQDGSVASFRVPAYLSFATGSTTVNPTERLRITSAGYIWAGTTSGFANGMTIKPATDNYTLTLLQTNADTAGYGMYCESSGGSLRIARYTSSAFNSPTMTMTAGGNVLIGTTTDAGQKLQVNGDGNFSGVLNVTGTNAFAIGSLSGTQRIQYGSSAANSFTLITAANAFANLYTADIIAAGSIKTAAPTTGTAANWKLGSRVAATVVVNTTEYIEVDIGGTLYKLATVT